MLPYDPYLTMVGVAISSLNLVALKWFNRGRRSTRAGPSGKSGADSWRGRDVGDPDRREQSRRPDRSSDLLVRWTGDQARMINAEQEAGCLRRPADRAAPAPVEPDHDPCARAGRPAGGMLGSLSIGGPGGVPVAAGRVQPAVWRPGPAGLGGPGAPGGARPAGRRPRPARSIRPSRAGRRHGRRHRAGRVAEPVASPRHSADGWSSAT